MAAFHNIWGWIAVGVCGGVGLWGLGLRIAGREPDRLFRYGTGVAVGAMILQVAVGLVMFGQGRRPGTIHVFYGIVILFTFAFAYIYRAQLAKRPALAWGLLLLFVMGLGIRAITSFGETF